MGSIGFPSGPFSLGRRQTSFYQRERWAAAYTQQPSRRKINYKTISLYLFKHTDAGQPQHYALRGTQQRFPYHGQPLLIAFGARLSALAPAYSASSSRLGPDREVSSGCLVPPPPRLSPLNPDRLPSCTSDRFGYISSSPLSLYSLDGILVFGLLFVCTCAYFKKVPRLKTWLLSEKKGVWGVFYKGEAMSGQGEETAISGQCGATK
nr:uncharacterized protein LOC112427949 [Macaca nemestrina]